MSKKDFSKIPNGEKAVKGLQIKKLLQAYKSVAKEMKKEAENYKHLSETVRFSSSKEVFCKYQESWKRLLYLNDIAYNIMYEYRELCRTPMYKALFFFGILPKQHSFRFIEGSKCWFKYTKMLSLVAYK